MGCCPTTLVQHGEPSVTVPPNAHLQAPHCAWPYGGCSSTSPVSRPALEMADEQLGAPRSDYDLVDDRFSPRLPTTILRGNAIL